MAKEKTEEVVKVTEKPPVDIDAFIARKLVSINKMENRAKARVLGERVLKNR